MESRALGVRALGGAPSTKPAAAGAKPALPALHSRSILRASSQVCARRDGLSAGLELGLLFALVAIAPTHTHWRA